MPLLLLWSIRCSTGSSMLQGLHSVHVLNLMSSFLSHWRILTRQDYYVSSCSLRGPERRLGCQLAYGFLT
ncbi:hypothetical protein QN277_002713 [Acacia crassicarpa]|uniref:Uncharacterized protein n=1 Tax=Acacia crassicarpa TaxID=499986 RepID=A0AAE1NBG0_9FABA|nr:hypothetical protein QN277_002713 [Acacia crassicarpa]